MIMSFILGIVGVATTKTQFSAHTGCIITANLSKVFVAVLCSATNQNMGLCTYVTSGIHKTVLPVYTTNNCTFRLYNSH